MLKNEYAHRQMLFDFHTSGDIPDVGKDFDPALFTCYLRDSGVERVTIFSKCHHSWSYYPTEIGLMHPNLKRNLCREMFDAAKQAGCKVILYQPIGWSEGDADRHPEWVAKNRDGSVSCSSPFDFENSKKDDFRPYYLWKQLCIRGGYREYCISLVKELLKQFPTLDGLFLDIMFRYRCYCPICIEEMKRQNVNPDDEKQVQEFSDQAWMSIAEEIKQILLKHNPNAEIFFNGGSDMNQKKWHDLHTHIELEDLPTAWGGYDKMPIRAKYFHRKGCNYCGMTAKFHAAWGEFGGFKNKEALRYEIAAMMAYGASVCIGDQIHPRGFLDPTTFANVGYAFDYAKQIESYCYDTEETSKLGVAITFNPEVDEGVAKVLLEEHLDFNIVLPEDCLDDFDVIILPEGVLIQSDCAEKYKKFLERGGKLLLVGNGGLLESTGQFLPELNLTYLGKSDDQIDYLQLTEDYAENLIPSPFLCNSSAHCVRNQNAKIKGVIKRPYFNRTMEHFCSHMTVPYQIDNADYPALLETDNYIYIAHDIFHMYFQYGMQLYRDLVGYALRKLVRKPMLEVKMMSAGRTRLAWQESKKRYILHLLYASPILRGGYQVLEDFPPIYDTEIRIRTDKKIDKVVLQPQNESLSFEKTEEGVSFIVPKFNMHQIVTLETI